MDFVRVYRDPSIRTIVCPECDGERTFEQPTHMSYWDGYVYTRDVACERCCGDGEIDVHDECFGVYEDGTEVLISQEQHDEFISDAIDAADHQEMIDTMDTVNEWNANHATSE